MRNKKNVCRATLVQFTFKCFAVSEHLLMYSLCDSRFFPLISGWIKSLSLRFLRSFQHCLAPRITTKWFFVLGGQVGRDGKNSYSWAKFTSNTKGSKWEKMKAASLTRKIRLMPLPALQHPRAQLRLGSQPPLHTAQWTWAQSRPRCRRKEGRERTTRRGRKKKKRKCELVWGVKNSQLNQPTFLAFAIFSDG